MRSLDVWRKIVICSILICLWISCFDCRKHPLKKTLNNANKLKKDHSNNHHRRKTMPDMSRILGKSGLAASDNFTAKNISSSTNADNNDDEYSSDNANNANNAIRDLIDEFKQWKTHNYAEMTWFLNFYNKSCGNMAHLYSIGTSVQNRDLWVMALGKQPHKHTPGIPEVKFVANAHGNEIAGKEILLYTIKYICENMNKDPEFGYLLSRLRLHILPSLNPDGYEMAYKKGFGDKFIGRLNSNGVDINRNFPDQFFPSYHDLEPETNAVMEWLKRIPFVLSASYHEGAIAVSYPYDDSPSGQTKYSATPDDDIFRRISIVYAENHPAIHQGASSECSNFQTKRFVGGVTNGAEWSSLTNTMQDYNYIFSNCFEITVHLSCKRNITFSQISDMFNENFKSMKEFMKQSLKGIKGFVVNEEGNPLQGVKISINDRKHDVTTAKNGDFWRLLLPGTYQLSVHHKEYVSYEKVITVDFDEAKFFNITLSKKQTDMALLRLGHVGLMKKISNIMMYESDGRDFEDVSLNNENRQDNKNEMEMQFNNGLTRKLEENQKNIPTLESGNVGPDNSSNSLGKIQQSNKSQENLPIPNDKVLDNQPEKMIIGVQLLCKVAGKTTGIEGKMKWMGTIKALSKNPQVEPPLIAGLELYKDDDLATDGDFLGVRYFKTKPKRAYFVPAKLCDVKT